MAKAIMIQGTMSNSGKSFITAGLCRIFAKAGYKVAPFKSQNMALNSYITKEGLEIGRAQAMQAMACGVDPVSDMNPILLKPTSNVGSQVILNGEVMGNMKAMDYYANKKKLIPAVMAAYERLSSAYDIIVIEGAGSPAEINLKDDDIVNMGMAKMAKAPVLLVGDIDRGGVFASLYGTVKLLEKDEQAMIKGMIINKFRGDVKILEPGLRMIEERVNIPVLGVVPMEFIDIDDEDSLSERLNQTGIRAGLDVAVIRLPHISNFTDFSVFERMPGVSLRYVHQPQQLKKPDLIILPGTKNTMDDLAWLRQTGLEGLILRCHEENVPVIGICGGYQMLGQVLEDPFCVEHGGCMRGMGLLDTKTVFEKAKTRTQISGHAASISGPFHSISNMPVEGYEIHMGITKNLGSCQPVIWLEDGRLDAVANEDFTVFGSYLHGLFDQADFTAALLKSLMEEKGIRPGTVIDVYEYEQQQYDKLAGLLSSALDMEQIYKILEKGV
ncbi:MAG TPA: cobyric acid synthase [Candidatus Scybalocola faecavium]|nr:cobyric acid synthase [Candidatus Scybalocola faecavium]